MLMVNLMELICVFLWFSPDTVSDHGLVLLCAFFFYLLLFCLVSFSQYVGFALVWIKKQIRSNGFLLKVVSRLCGDISKILQTTSGTVH